MELLLNISFTNEDGVIRQLIENISEEDFTNQVEIIGWLYQYYNSELKDEIFANLKKSIKISKENIPAATQLFTPDWIVKYMVENSVGRLWLESHPNEELKAKWNYYVEEAQQTPEVEAKLVEIRNNSYIHNPEDIKVIDPCMGSGHILVYVFDVLMQIYVSEGYTERDAAVSILENNIYGLDIDDRAYQLAYFAVMMKARQYNRKILKQNIIPTVYSIKESNNINFNLFKQINDKKVLNELYDLCEVFKDAKEYGAILNINNYNFNLLNDVIDNINQNKSVLRLVNYNDYILLKNIVKQAEVIYQKYDVVVTNPPYMGNKGMNSNLKNFIKNNYPLTKSDLFAVFIEKGLNFIKETGINCMVTMQSWMFLSSFEKFREKLLSNVSILNLMHMENMVMRIAFGTSVSIFRKMQVSDYNSTFLKVKLSDLEDGSLNPSFFNSNNKYVINQSNFDKIPGSPIAYWADKHVFEAFEKGTPLIELSDIKQGLATADNNRFLRYWFEVDYHNIGFNYKSCDESKS